MYSFSLNWCYFPNPDVSETYGISVVLQSDWEFWRMRLVLRRPVKWSVSKQLEVVLYKHAVVKHSHSGRFCKLPFCVKTWGVPDNIVAVPLSWFPHDVDQRWCLFVDRSGLAIVIGRVLV